jgi:hypothetical protein
VQLRHAALRLLKGYLGELGLTPAAIGRVDRATLPMEDDFDSVFLFGKRGRRRADPRERFFA